MVYVICNRLGLSFQPLCFLLYLLSSNRSERKTWNLGRLFLRLLRCMLVPTLRDQSNADTGEIERAITIDLISTN
ncbi:unnamed protein product [Oikopleura dioica]|uniref:Uncharacterized protein n=1 Tax=Oikopleura dioica TaxID=34765 RepID=E4X4E4_OIKDI|nr:unnamed protein product [Oikopleura dioica]